MQGNEYGTFCRMFWRNRPLLGIHVIFEHLLDKPWGVSSHGCQLGAYQPLQMKLNYACPNPRADENLDLPQISANPHELCLLQNSYVEILILSVSECDLIWE